MSDILIPLNYFQKINFISVYDDRVIMTINHQKIGPSIGSFWQFLLDLNFNKISNTFWRTKRPNNSPPQHLPGFPNCPSYLVVLPGIFDVNFVIISVH